ncbi:embryonal Fyn-associated substrate isoform 2-T5 [Sarcophilus harrisii]
MAVSAQLARALYDNTAESPEELSFKRGDVLRVLQGEGAGGLQGWCLCSLHGQQGIVPANRVKLLPTGPSPESSLYQVPPTPQSTSDSAPGPGPVEQEVYVIPPPPRPCSAPRPSPGPCPPSPDAIYKVPRSSGTQTDTPGDTREVYDVPPTALRVPPNDPYDSPVPFPRPLTRASTQQPGEDDAPYDVPPALKPSPELDLEWEGGREPEPPLYAAPSNLKRASALLNLYEAPEELLGEGTSSSSDEAIYDVPLLGPEEPLPPAPPTPPGSNPAPSDLETLALLLARSPPPPPRPRLPSTESLSRRPLPALPVQELSAPSPVPSPASGRKGSIQDRPLPPPPPRLPSYMGLKTEGAEEGRVGDAGAGTAEPHNEYEGIPLGEEYDYVHLKGMERIQGSDPLDGATLGDPEPRLRERLLQEEQDGHSGTASLVTLLLLPAGGPDPRGAPQLAVGRPAAAALLCWAVPEPLFGSAGSRGSLAGQYQSQSPPSTICAPQQTSGSSSPPAGVCRGHPGPAGCVSSFACPGWHCGGSPGSGTTGRCAGCQECCSRLPLRSCCPRDGPAGG